MSATITDSPLQSLLLPRFWKTVGWLIAIPGFLLGLLKLTVDYRPKILTVPVLAVYYSMFETKFFTVFNHNVIDELGLLLSVVGLFCIAFAREKEEDEIVAAARARALLLSMYAEAAFVAASTIFIFGIAFLHALIVSTIFPFISYMILFKFSLRRERKLRNVHSPLPVRDA